MSNEPIGKDCNGVELFVGDKVSSKNELFILTGSTTDETFMDIGNGQKASLGTYTMLTGKRILSSKFKLVKKPKVVYIDSDFIIKASKQDVIDSFKKIYLDWDETMKNIDTAFERNV
jgi:hypothetical protein